jgi:hypothetical protein
MRHDFRPAPGVSGQRAGDPAIDHAPLERDRHLVEGDRDAGSAHRLDEVHRHPAAAANALAGQVLEAGDLRVAEHDLRRLRQHRQEDHVVGVLEGFGQMWAIGVEDLARQRRIGDRRKIEALGPPMS